MKNTIITFVYSVLITMGVQSNSIAQKTYIIDQASFGTNRPGLPISFNNRTFLVLNSLTLTTGFTLKATDGPFHAKMMTETSGENTPVSSNKNYIRTEQILVAGKTTDAQITALNNGIDKFTSFQYSDGMGRAMQSVNVKGSLSGKDVVSFAVYDQYGRTPKEYMPYVGSTTTGQFQASTTAPQSTFYNNPPTSVPQDTRPFTEYQFDGARVTSVTDPGQAWSSKSSSSVVKVFASNTIRKWSINGTGIPVTTATYPANLLVYSESTDINGQIARTYKDQWGRVVLSEIENGATDIRTYYVYDIRGNQLAIVPPKAVNLIEANGWVTTAAVAAGLCYTNTYDAKGRLIEKYIPGKEVVYFVYDKWDRLVLSQDGNQRAGSPDEWTFTKYDAFSRPVVTGVYETNSSRTSLQSTLEGHLGHHETRNATSVGYSLNASYPTTVDENDLLAITYYDDYGFASGWTGYSFNSSVAGFTGVKSNAVKGQTTGSKTRILGTTDWLKAVTYYDVDYQPLQTIVQNHLGGIDIATTEYDYTGQIIKTLYEHTSDYGSLTLLEEYEYDNAGRLVSTYQTTQGGARVLVANNVYNEMGIQIERNLHSTDGGNSFLQSVDYRSNIRGWLTSMNNADLSSNAVNNDTNDLFGMELDYTTGTTVAGKTIPANFNGNITAAKWQSNNLEDTPKKQIFGYEYDNLNRITSATFAADNNGNWANDQNFYNTSYTYKDAQGGFDKVTREGRSGTSSTTTIDDLTYSYYANTNQISKVDDAATDEGFTDGVQMPTEYTYDDNGNMVSDQNAFITDITYNILDKPERITLMPTSGTIYLDFTYDAAGNKLSTTVSGPGTTETYTIDYVGGIHYINNELAYMLTPEGRILKYGSNYEYEYHVKDHLGNTRLTFGNLHDTQVFKATMETEYSNTEEAQFVNVNETRDGIHNRTTADYTVINPLYSARVAKDMTGSGIAIPVQAGDNIRAEVWARFGGYQSGSGSAIIGGLLGSVANMFNITSGESPATFNALSDALAALAGDWGYTSTDIPEAYINMVFISTNGLETYMMYDGITASAFGNHEQLNVAYEASEDGMVYIYVANENSEPGDVWFDDLLVVHEKTTSSLNVAQTNDYYPFGMVMEGTAYDDQSRDAYCNCESYTSTNPNAGAGGGPNGGDPDLIGVPDIPTCASLAKYSGLANRYKFNGNEVLEGEGIPTTLNLMNFNARLYNPALGVFLAVDPAGQFSSPYLAFGNNPVLYIDKDGRFAWVPFIVGTVVNVGIDAVNGNINSWGDLGISVLKGAAFSFLGNYGNVGQAIVYPIFAAYAPSYDIPVTDNFSLGVSPALFIGSDNLGLGANVTANAQIGDFSLSGGLGVTGFSKFGATGGNKMAEFRGSYGAGYDDGNFGVRLSSITFGGGGIENQTIGQIDIRNNDFRFSYSNDWFFGLPTGDNGDRFRTAAIRVGHKEFGVGLRMFTGDPGLDKTIRDGNIDYGEGLGPNGTYVKRNGSNPNEFRAGLLSLEYGNYRVGVNSEGVRAFVQNTVIHDWLKPTARFQRLNIPTRPYFQYVISNPFTLW